jgi:flagellar protein FlaI
MDCDQYSAEISEIEGLLGPNYLGKFFKEIFITREDFEDIKEDIKGKVGEKFTDDAIDCYIYTHGSLGKVTPFIFSEDLEEIMVVGKDLPVFVYDRFKGMIKTDVSLSEDEIREVIEKIGRYAGRAVGPDNPLLDARLPDGSRVNATLQSVSPKGSSITIRRFKSTPLNILDLIKFDTIDLALTSFLWLVVDGLGVKPANILIVGGTASGKTTTLNTLSGFIPESQRIVSIEDTQELSLEHENWVPLETKPPSPGGENEVTMDDLLKNALRMRPDRIIVGEVRGREALSLFSAMNTGHDGCMATIHANSCREALTRIQSHPMLVPDIMIPALDLIVAQKRYTKGQKLYRRIVEVAEVAGREGDQVLLNTLFTYDTKIDRLNTNIMNGRIIQELASLTGFSVKELNEEISKREVILDTMMDYELSNTEIATVIKGYYSDPDSAIDLLYSLVKERAKKTGSVGVLGF